MSRLFVFQNHRKSLFGRQVACSLWLLLLCFSIEAWAQSAAPSARASFSIRATHLLGFPNTKNNCNGDLTIKDDALRFEQDSKPEAEVKIASVQGVFLGSESKQVGGKLAKVGKAAAPYGGGRAVSLFAHKKYDSLTVEYADDDGGVHGAIFQLSKGKAENVRRELVARGASPGLRDDDSMEASTAEVSHENK